MVGRAAQPGKHLPALPNPHPNTHRAGEPGWVQGLYLGGDDEQGGLRVQVGQGFGNVSPIDVGDKPDPGAS